MFPIPGRWGRSDPSDQWGPSGQWALSGQLRLPHPQNQTARWGPSRRWDQLDPWGPSGQWALSGSNNPGRDCTCLGGSGLPRVDRRRDL